MRKMTAHEALACISASTSSSDPKKLNPFSAPERIQNPWTHRAQPHDRGIGQARGLKPAANQTHDTAVWGHVAANRASKPKQKRGGCECLTWRG